MQINRQIVIPLNKWQGRRLVFQTLLFMPLTVILLKIFGFKRAYRLFLRLTPLRHKTFDPEAELGKSRLIAAYVTSANRNYAPIIFSCLPESLTLWLLLRRFNIAADFCLGVRMITGPFGSHAWVAYNGAVLNDLENISTIYAPFNLECLLPE